MDIILGNDEDWIGFSDLALLFKVTTELDMSNLNQKELVCKSCEPLGRRYHICMNKTFGQN